MGYESIVSLVSVRLNKMWYNKKRRVDGRDNREFIPLPPIRGWLKSIQLGSTISLISVWTSPCILVLYK